MGLVTVKYEATIQANGVLILFSFRKKYKAVVHEASDSIQFFYWKERLSLSASRLGPNFWVVPKRGEGGCHKEIFRRNPYRG